MLEENEGKDDIDYADTIAHKMFPLSEKIGLIVSELEENVSEEIWPLPTYFDLLFVR